MAQMMKHLPAMWETRVRFLGQEDPLEKEMATYSSTLAWKTPWTEERRGLQLQSMGLHESDTTQQLNHHHLYFIWQPSPKHIKRFKYDSFSSSEDLQKVREINVYINKLPYREG